MTMKNKIIIMGATSGIGRALAETFASRGVRIGIAGRSANILKELEQKYPGCIVGEIIDITRPEAKTGLTRLIDKLGGLDLYIHVAGIGAANPALNPEEEVKVVNTDASAFARMVSCAYNYFRSTGRSGQIAAVTSVSATRGIGDMAAYSASKAFAAAYMEALAQLAHKQHTCVVFTDIQPGWVRTPLLRPDKIYPMEMSLSHVVPLILKAIAEKRRVAVIDWRWRMLKKLWRRIPGRIWLRMSGSGF